MDSSYKHISEDIRKDIESILISAGLLFRVFGRGKSRSSLEGKIKLKNQNGEAKYQSNGKRIQDSIGIRVVLYFSDDIDTVKTILNQKYKLIESDSMIDKPEGDEFTVTRYNLIYQCPGQYSSGLEKIINEDPIDLTFEVQIRSVLSEGWHEVEHDLRYKQKNTGKKAQIYPEL